jgi:hypothetical protein
MNISEAYQFFSVQCHKRIKKIVIFYALDILKDIPVILFNGYYYKSPTAS